MYTVSLEAIVSDGECSLSNICRFSVVTEDHPLSFNIGVGTGGALGAYAPQYFGSLIQILFQCPPNLTK